MKLEGDGVGKGCRNSQRNRPAASCRHTSGVTSQLCVIKSEVTIVVKPGVRVGFSHGVHLLREVSHHE